MGKEMDPITARKLDDVGVRGEDATRKAMKGWNAIQARAAKSEEEREISRKKAEYLAEKERKKMMQEHGYDHAQSPRQPQVLMEEEDQEATTRRLMQATKQMQQSQQAQKFFEGPAELVMLKLATMFEGDAENGVKPSNPKIIKVSEAGLNRYKVTYIPG